MINSPQFAVTIIDLLKSDNTLNIVKTWLKGFDMHRELFRDDHNED
jgi:hypothetical protein